ncbi:uncharacterized protein TNCV_1413611 [Trichonephila clavipes]|nr:uncharacterized protein TNCV_1413611 [Trichonephila clavipes]
MILAYDCHGWLGCSQSGRQFSMTFFPTFCGRISAITRRMLSSNGQAFVAYPHRPMTLHSPTENSLAVLNHKILEANSQVQNVKLGGHQTCLSINRLWHELCDMLHRIVRTAAPGHRDCSIQGMKKLVIMALYRSPLTVTLWPSSFFEEYGPMIPPAHKAQTSQFSGCNGVSTYTCGLASLKCGSFLLST